MNRDGIVHRTLVALGIRHEENEFFKQVYEAYQDFYRSAQHSELFTPLDNLIKDSAQELISLLQYTKTRGAQKIVDDFCIRLNDYKKMNADERMLIAAYGTMAALLGYVVAQYTPTAGGLVMGKVLMDRGHQPSEQFLYAISGAFLGYMAGNMVSSYMTPVTMFTGAYLACQSGFVKNKFRAQEKKREKEAAAQQDSSWFGRGRSASK